VKRVYLFVAGLWLVASAAQAQSMGGLGTGGAGGIGGGTTGGTGGTSGSSSSFGGSSGGGLGGGTSSGTSGTGFLTTTGSGTSGGSSFLGTTGSTKTTTNAISNSNPFQSYFANPLYQGLPGGTGNAGGFGQVLYTITSTNSSITGSLGRSGIGTGTGTGFAPTVPGGTRRLAPYVTEVDVGYQPPTPTQLQPNLQQVLTRSSSLGPIRTSEWQWTATRSCFRDRSLGNGTVAWRKTCSACRRA